MTNNSSAIVTIWPSTFATDTGDVSVIWLARDYSGTNGNQCDKSYLNHSNQGDKHNEMHDNQGSLGILHQVTFARWNARVPVIVPGFNQNWNISAYFSNTSPVS